MSEITRRDLLKVLGASGVMLGGMSGNVIGLDKLIRGDSVSNLGIEMGKSYGADLIKPGTIIDSGNYINFPQLKELLPEHQYLRLKKGATRSDLPPMHIVPTRKLNFTKTEQAWEEKNKGVVQMDPKTHALINWKAGRPFPEPKNMYEVTWNFYLRHLMYGDAEFFRNGTFAVVDSLNRRKDVSFKIWTRMWQGRTTVPPVPEYSINPDNIYYKQTTVFTKPYDAAGFAVLRHRYFSPDKADDAWAYVPAIRRVRRFTGDDLQDPLFGTDVTMDDFGGWIQKVDFKNVVPTKVEDGLILCYAYLPKWYDGHSVKIDKNNRQAYYPSWEIRPVYKLTVEIKNPGYGYGKRVTWIDKETDMGVYMEFYDQKGRLFRTWLPGYSMEEDGSFAWGYIEAEDWINGSKTHILIQQDHYNATFSDEVFSKEYLRQLGR